MNVSKEHVVSIFTAVCNIICSSHLTFNFKSKLYASAFLSSRGRHPISVGTQRLERSGTYSASPMSAQIKLNSAVQKTILIKPYSMTYLMFLFMIINFPFICVLASVLWPTCLINISHSSIRLPLITFVCVVSKMRKVGWYVLIFIVNLSSLCVI